MKDLLIRMFLFICFVVPTAARSDMSFGKAMMVKITETPLATVQKHYKETSVKRPLTDNEKNVQIMLGLANAMGVTTIISRTENFDQFDSRVVVDSMIKQMHAHPKWDVSLKPDNLKAINEYSDMLKNSFGDKSYGWAWIQKQNGQTQTAKQILSDLFKSGLASAMSQRYRGFGYADPLSDMTYIQTALEPLSSASEKREMDAKMQKLKTYYSNLPPSNIQT